VELRRNKRYRLKSPTIFSEKRADRHTIHCEGFTRDISAGGVFISTAELLPVGSIVQMEIRVSPERVKLRTQGRVVRTEAQGFAVVADMGFRMLFRNTPRRAMKIKSEDTSDKYQAAVMLN
jgi:PilZ domain-containing protein